MSPRAAFTLPASVEQPEWRTFVTPKELRRAPVHRWFVFPHSFSEGLVQALLSEWRLGSRDWLLDPFVGAGTTLVAAQHMGIPSIGFDISPLAVFVSAAKTHPVSANQLRNAWTRLAVHLNTSRRATVVADQDVVRRAFDDPSLSALTECWSAIRTRVRRPSVRALIEVAFLGILPRYSRLVNKGGWLTEGEPDLPVETLFSTLQDQVELICEDLANEAASSTPSVVEVTDARWLPVPAASISAVITSPPYPNRHDYTRVFGVELAFAFLDSRATKALRYQSFSSHPESKPLRPSAVAAYQPPMSLKSTLSRIGERILEPRAKQRIPNMLAGYFADLYCSLVEIERVLRPGAPAAYVVGNVQYCGISLPVDHLLCDIARQVGLVPDEIRIARRRGNSAQQMGTYGRRPARESVVVVRKPSRG